MLWLRYLTQNHEIFTQKIGIFFQNFFCIVRSGVALFSYIWFGMKHPVFQELWKGQSTSIHLSNPPCLILGALPPSGPILTQILHERTKSKQNCLNLGHLRPRYCPLGLRFWHTALIEKSSLWLTFFTGFSIFLQSWSSLKKKKKHSQKNWISISSAPTMRDFSHVNTPLKIRRTGIKTSLKILHEFFIRSLSVKVTLKYVISSRVIQKLSKKCQPMAPNFFFRLISYYCIFDESSKLTGETNLFVNEFR